MPCTWAMEILESLSRVRLTVSMYAIAYIEHEPQQQKTIGVLQPGTSRRTMVQTDSEHLLILESIRVRNPEGSVQSGAHPPPPKGSPEHVQIGERSRQPEPFWGI